MELRVFCGGSDTPFVFNASLDETMEIFDCMDKGKPIHMIGDESVVHFNTLRIDAIMVMEKEG